MKHNNQIWTATAWDLIFSYEYSLLQIVELTTIPFGNAEINYSSALT